jgi:hypothetical protein
MECADVSGQEVFFYRLRVSESNATVNPAMADLKALNFIAPRENLSAKQVFPP